MPVNPSILQYDLYRMLRLQFLVLLMMGAVTPETCRVTFVVNKYLHTVASSWIFINIISFSFEQVYEVLPEDGA